MSNVKIGIIGGSGLDNPDILENRKEVTVTTPYGKTSDKIICGEIKGIECVLLARHGRNHSIMPSSVPYRANIWAMKSLKCTHLLVSTATGSLQEHIKAGDLVIPNDFIDRTTKRDQTLFDGENLSGVCHLPMYPAFCEKTRQVLIDVCNELKLPIHTKATVVTIEGPRFSSRAESRMFRQWGGDIINMTTCPEVILAKEAGLLYAAVAIATDYDCWRENCETVNVQDVLKIFGENVTKVKQLLMAAVEKISQKDWKEELELAKKTVEDNTMGKV